MDALKPVLQRINALLQNFESVEAKSQAVPDQAHLKTKIEADTQILLKQLLEDSDLSPSSAYHSNQTLGNFPQLAALKELDPDDKTLPLRQNVQQAIDYIREPLVENQIKPELVEEVIDTHVTIPLRNYLTEETAAQQIAAEVEQMVSKRAELDLQHQAHLQDAATRNDRQSAKLEYYERREQFFLQSLQTLERQVLKDKQTLGTLATADTPEGCPSVYRQLAAHLQSLAHLSSQCNRLHHTVQHKACVYAPSPPQLLAQLQQHQHALAANTGELTAALQQVEALMQSRASLCHDIFSVKAQQLVHDEVQRRVEAERVRVTGHLEQEASKLSSMADTIETFKANLDPHVKAIHQLCLPHQGAAMERVTKHAALFASLYSEYYSQLHDLHEGKQKCLKALKSETRRCTKEAERWEALEHEIPGVQHLLQLDEKLTQLKELQAAMGTEAEVLQHKLAEIEGCGAAILSEVPGFVHPKDDLSRRLAATLATKREQLQTIYLKYLSVPVSNSDLSSSSGQDSEASEAIPKRVIESPYKIRRRLKKLSTQLGSPDAPKSPQGCADTGTPQPTPQQLNRARSLKRAMATRGAPMRSKRHKSQ
eukprot:NODE_710_length_1925_cov_24.441046_g659_i0.p1 GENE.NODE_710_length_1925_cov_24.441046_g659_i0~~NODE_710_length_1925_cov_24.441046_g659_i0.p1  ORF type:complete len:596 (-),score=162.28 NODE_710_length_1925_cov_24.441046_g659_i0:138-1925(-)